ncbi:MAG: TauD/TfdA family dioxygenase [bacterium]|jgi:alpha-ketoglutarate-dependent 2,4-dichlorophenoxyacetate dioxygenase
MALEFRRLQPQFFAEAGPIALRETHDDQTLAAIRAAMDAHAVIVFHAQAFTDAEQLDFARRLDGMLHAKTGARVVAKNRLGEEEALTDISNVGNDGALLPADDRQRLYRLGNRLWHTDASFEDPAGRYSMLHARVVPPAEAGGDTEFADMRAAYDALSPSMQARLEGLRVRHSIAYSRQTLGFDFSAEEAMQLPGAEHPLVRMLPAGRKSLYLASHAAEIIGWNLPEGRLLLRELMEHATQPQFVYRHAWRAGDLVIWDNRATMHRATPFDDASLRRELRRVTTLDVAA